MRKWNAESTPREQYLRREREQPQGKRGPTDFNFGRNYIAKEATEVEIRTEGSTSQSDMRPRTSPQKGDHCRLTMVIDGKQRVGRVAKELGEYRQPGLGLVGPQETRHDGQSQLR